MIEEIANEVLFGRQLEYTVTIKPKNKSQAREENRIANKIRNNKTVTTKKHCHANSSLLSELLTQSNKKAKRFK